MSYSVKMSPSSRRCHGDREEVLNHQPGQEQRGLRSAELPRSNFDRRSGRGGGFRGKPEGGGWRDRRREGRPRSDQRFFHNDNRGRVEYHDRGSENQRSGLGDHCRENSGLRDAGKGEESLSEITKAHDQGEEKEQYRDIKKFETDNDVRSDIKKEIGKIKKVLNLSGDKTGEGGGFSIKRQATDDLEEVKPKKKKKKRKSKTAAAAAEKRENGDSSDKTIPKPKEIITLEKDNSLLRNKLQEILDENMKLKVDFQSLKRKWDDADSRIGKLEELARDKDAKIVELEHENVKRVDKLEVKNRIISDLEKENKIAVEKLDTKRKLIRDLDCQILAKDEKYEMIKKEVDEKERHLNKLMQVKDELYKSKEVATKENEEIKKLAKGISNDSDVLVEKLFENEELIANLKRQLRKVVDNQNSGVESSSFALENIKLKEALVAKENDIKCIQEERDESVQLQVELECTVKDLKHQIRMDISTKKEVPETTLSEKCDSSVAYDDDSENYDLEDDTSLAIGNELPDSLFEPLSDEMCYADDDLEVLKVTSTESPKKYISVAKKIVSPKKSCPFKLKRVREYSTESSPKKTPYKIWKRKLINVEVPCLNVIPDSSSKMMVTLDDFARGFYSNLSVKRVGIILEELDIPLYTGNIVQQQILRQEGVKYAFNPIPLIMCEDVEKNQDDLNCVFSNFLKDI